MKHARNFAILYSKLFVAMSFVIVCLPGCVSIAIVDNGFAGLGLFHSQQKQLVPGVEYHKNVGIGIYIEGNRLGLGYIDQQYVICEQDEEGVHLITPLGEIATGKQAERLAGFGVMLTPTAQGIDRMSDLDLGKGDKDVINKSADDQHSNPHDRLSSGDELAWRLR